MRGLFFKQIIMATKPFQLKLFLNDKEVMKYESDKEDSVKHDPEAKRIDLNLKGDKFPFIESIRFNEIELTEGKGKAKKLKAKAYTKILDNGFTKLSFRLK